MIPDRIEAGTLLIATIATRGDVLLKDVNAEHLPNVLDKLRSMGAEIDAGANSIRVRARNGLKSVDVTTQPYPGYPTDLQAQIMALACVAEGASRIKETIFENRFLQAAELRRMGANIEIDGNTALVRGVPALSGAPVMASDLRASAALVLAGLCARGTTQIHRIYHIERGYERIDEKLRSVGAEIERKETEGS